MFGPGTYLGGGIGALIGIALTYTAMSIVIIPRERADARQGYVLVAEKVAAEAKANELERQLRAGQEVISAYQATLKKVRVEDAEQDSIFERDRKVFEDKIKAVGRTCGLNSDDLLWLRQ